MHLMACLFLSFNYYMRVVPTAPLPQVERLQTLILFYRYSKVSFDSCYSPSLPLPVDNFVPQWLHLIDLRPKLARKERYEITYLLEETSLLIFF